MDRAVNMPRRAWQRRNLRRNRATDSNLSTEQSAQRVGTASAQNKQPISGQEKGDETDSSVGSASDAEAEEDYGPTRRPTAPRMAPAARPRRQRSSTNDLSGHTCSSSDSDSDSEDDDDSGYCSLDDDADGRAEYYDDLLERFRKEGPVLANHGDNTKKMETEQEGIWNK